MILSRQSSLSHDARCVAVELLRRSDSEGKSFPSLTSIAESWAMRRARVVAAIKELKNAAGPVRVTVKGGWCRKDGRGRAPNVYTQTVDLGPASEPKSNQEFSTPGVRKSSTDLSSDLSPDVDGPEFPNGGDLSSDVRTGTVSGTVPITDPVRRGARVRETLPDASNGKNESQESGYHLALRCLVDAWQKHYGEPYLLPAAKGERKAIEHIGIQAAKLAQKTGTPPEAIMRHWATSYLADENPWLVEHRHALRWLDERLNKYGSKPTPSPLAARSDTPSPLPKQGTPSFGPPPENLRPGFANGGKR